MDPRRLVTEAAVIVGSILLAFAIDAAWEDRAERKRLDDLTESLIADVEATLGSIEARATEAETVASRAREILGAIAAGATGPDLDSAVFQVGNVFVKGDWAPINHTYEQALGSGDLTLIRDSSVRLLIGRYAESLSDVLGMQTQAITQYYSALEPFLVTNTDYSEVAWEGAATDLVRGPFATDSRALGAQREFSNLLNLKLELELEMLTSLAEAQSLAEEVLLKLRGQ